MTAAQLWTAAVIALLLVLAYWLGRFLGANAQRELWSDHMDKGNRYIFAVDDLDRWCGHHSPHARLIARHLRALGDGIGHNAGTPVHDEACSISGLRAQLQQLDAALSQSAAHPEAAQAEPDDLTWIETSRFDLNERLAYLAGYKDGRQSTPAKAEPAEDAAPGYEKMRGGKPAVFWRDDALEAAAGIVEAYQADPWIARDIRAMKSKAEAERKSAAAGERDE